jgi:hypothetical protein
MVLSRNKIYFVYIVREAKILIMTTIEQNKLRKNYFNKRTHPIEEDG